MPDNLGIAILGSGIFARIAYLPALAKLGYSLEAIYSRSTKGASALASSARETLGLSVLPAVYSDEDTSKNLDALLARPDIKAVLVILSITLQPSIILKALGAGKHVLCEKPIAPDVAAGEHLIAAYEEKYKPQGLIWRVAENFEAEPAYRLAAKAIKDGKIGDVLFFNVKMVSAMTKESEWYKDWRIVPDYQGGYILDAGVHQIAALRIMLPHPITHLSGFASLNKEYLLPHDTINVIAKCSSHAHGIVEMSFANPTPSSVVPDNIVITGSTGVLTITPVEGNIRRVKIVTVIKEEGKPDAVHEELFEEKGKGVEVEVESFMKAVGGLDDGLGLGDPRGALSDVAFIQAALHSDGQLLELSEEKNRKVIVKV